MKGYLITGVTAAVGLYALVQLGEKLSTDAVSMGVGILFGMLAGVPTALLIAYTMKQSQLFVPEQPRLPEKPVGTITFPRHPEMDYSMFSKISPGFWSYQPESSPWDLVLIRETPSGWAIVKGDKISTQKFATVYDAIDHFWGNYNLYARA